MDAPEELWRFHNLDESPPPDPSCVPKGAPV